MSTPSTAEPASADVSLSDPAEPYSHRGLTYPFGRRFPDIGEVISVAPGIGWARLPVPGSLKHVNIWALDDGDGIAIVDTGLDIPPCREGWENLLAGPLAGKTVTRIIVTHFHPDHLGLAGWLAERFDVQLWMTQVEWLYGRMLTADVRKHPPREAFAYWRAAGWSEERIGAEVEKGWGRFAALVSPVPVSYVRMQDGDTLRIGGSEWRVVVGSGHCPEHVCLVSEAGGVMIAGDQVLPKITSNVSLSLSEPQGDPLGDWLASIEKLRSLSGDLLVLPSHGEPFTGLHARLDSLSEGHAKQLDSLVEHLSEPRRGVDCFSVLFARKIEGSSYGLATGEAMAHLRRLEVTRRARREVKDGAFWYSRT